MAECIRPRGLQLEAHGRGQGAGIEGGAEGEIPCILGTAQDGDGLKPGEVRLSGGESWVRLGQRLELGGELYLNGSSLYDVIRDIVSELLR